MTGYNSSLQNLTEQFRKLQGIGAKTAQRLAYYVLSMPPEDVEEFAAALLYAKDHVRN